MQHIKDNAGLTIIPCIAAYMILYLHGFRSGPQSNKVQQLAQRVAAIAPETALWCEQLSHVPFEAIALAESVIRSAKTKPVLVGSSLGGFYATYLAQKHALQAVLINPFVPHEAMDVSAFLGEHENLYNGERFVFTQAHVEQIRALDVPRITQPELFWLLAEEADEVLDVRHAVQRYAGSRQTVLAGGDHSFTRWPDYLDAVIRLATRT